MGTHSAGHLPSWKVLCSGGSGAEDSRHCCQLPGVQPSSPAAGVTSLPTVLMAGGMEPVPSITDCYLGVGVRAGREGEQTLEFAGLGTPY